MKRIVVLPAINLLWVQIDVRPEWDESDIIEAAIEHYYKYGADEMNTPEPQEWIQTGGYVFEAEVQK
jgi:hypothetical protein